MRCPVPCYHPVCSLTAVIYPLFILNEYNTIYNIRLFRLDSTSMWELLAIDHTFSPSSSTSLIMSMSSCSVGFWPRLLITIPSSLLLMNPLWSLSNSSNASRTSENVNSTRYCKKDEKCRPEKCFNTVKINAFLKLKCKINTLVVSKRLNVSSTFFSQSENNMSFIEPSVFRCP